MWRLMSLSLAQKHDVDNLWLSDGVCVCGNPIKHDDAKMALAQVNTSWSPLPGARNTIAVGIYCGPCADKINVALRNLRALPERDKLKSRKIS